MVSYTTITIGSFGQVGSGVQTSTADFTGSFFSTEANNNQVRLTQLSSTFNGSFFETTTAQFTGSRFGVVNSSDQLALSGTVTAGVNGSFFETNDADFTGSKFGVKASGNSIMRSGLEWYTGSLLGWWKFNDSGITFVDSSANGNTATIDTGVAFSGGFFGSGVFTSGGASDGLHINHSVSINPTGTKLTIAAWAHPKSFSSNSYIIAKPPKSGISLTAIWRQYALGFNSDKARFSLVSGTTEGLSAWDLIPNFAVTPGSWHRIVGVYDTAATGSEMKLYVDGVLKGFNSGPPAIGSYGGSTLYIGKPGYSDYDEGFHGNIDDLRMYNVPWSQDDVTNDYNAGLGRDNHPGNTFGVVGSYLVTKHFGTNDFRNVGSLIWNMTSGTNEFVKTQVRLAPSGQTFGNWSTLTTASPVQIGSTNIGSIQVLFLVSGVLATLESSPRLNDWNINHTSASSEERVTIGSYLATKNMPNGSFYNVGSLVWNMTSGTDESVFAQYRTAGSNTAFGAWSSLSRGGVQTINGSNIGSVQTLFLLSGPGTSTPEVTDWNVNFNSTESYRAEGSYLITQDLGGGVGSFRHPVGVVWHSGGTGPVSLDYRYSNDLTTFTGFSGDSTGSFTVPENISYRYVQLLFHLSGTGGAE